MNIMKFALILCLTVWLSSCSSRADSFDNSQATVNIHPQTNSIPNRDKAPVCSDGFEYSIYSGLLSKLIDDANSSDPASPFDPFHGTDRLVVRRETIVPNQPARLVGNPAFASGVVQCLLNSASRSKNVRQNYEVYHSVSVHSGPSDLSKFFGIARKRFPDTKAVVAFSNVSLDRETGNAIVYFEYFSPQKNLLKFYFTITLDITDEPGKIITVGDRDSQFHDFDAL